jgi:hypothetical protein
VKATFWLSGDQSRSEIRAVAGEGIFFHGFEAFENYFFIIRRAARARAIGAGIDAQPGQFQLGLGHLADGGQGRPFDDQQDIGVRAGHDERVVRRIDQFSDLLGRHLIKQFFLGSGGQAENQ